MEKFHWKLCYEKYCALFYDYLFWDFWELHVKDCHFGREVTKPFWWDGRTENCYWKWEMNKISLRITASRIIYWALVVKELTEFCMFMVS